MEINAHTQGVRRGGLTNVTEIRNLLCYLISTASPVDLDTLQRALLGEELVNYFELMARLEDIVKQELAERRDDVFYSTPKGCEIAREIGGDLPLSVRQSAARAVMRLQTLNRLANQNLVELQPVEHGFMVKCRIVENNDTLFRMEIPAPDELTANLIKRQFVENGGTVYAQMLETLMSQPEDPLTY